ncbi:MAG: hypothetical protein QXS27_01305 [Candidatus Jordarchaeaceae archaeon]
MNQDKVGHPSTYTHSPNPDPSSNPGPPLNSPTTNWLASPKRLSRLLGSKPTITLLHSLAEE